MDPHEAVLSAWAEREHHRGKGFIRDGIIDAARWAGARRRVLLLLKEAYGELRGSGDWDLCKVIREEWQGPKHKIWHTAAYWCYAAQNTVPQLPIFPPSREAAADALLRAAFVEIKKSNSSSSSNNDDISSYAERDGDLIKRQIELIKPEIILCGNTWWAVKHLWPEAQQEYDAVWKTKHFSFVDFWHPANRFPHSLNYYALGCLLQNAQV
jgi:hypothetical protein